MGVPLFIIQNFRWGVSMKPSSEPLGYPDGYGPPQMISWPPHGLNLKPSVILRAIGLPWFPNLLRFYSFLGLTSFLLVLTTHSCFCSPFVKAFDFDAQPVPILANYTSFELVRSHCWLTAHRCCFCWNPIFLLIFCWSYFHCCWSTYIQHDDRRIGTRFSRPQGLLLCTPSGVLNKAWFGVRMVCFKQKR